MSELMKIKTVSQIHDFLELPKPKHPLISVHDHFSAETFEKSRGWKFSAELYQISLKEGFSGSIGYGRNSYDFQEGTLIFTSPNQVLTIGEFDVSPANYTGWNLAFHPDLIRKSELGSKIEQYSFFSYDVHEALHVSEQEKKSIKEIVQKIQDEYNHIIDQHSQTLIISNLELLLNYCTRFYDRQFYTRTNLNKDFISTFERLLKDYFTSNKPLELGLPTVTYCGREMNMSPKYLSDLLKKETGKTAQELIHDKVIDKAKTQLASTTHSISEIAYDLGFEYSQHFAKLFKRKTGTSPSEYRGNSFLN